MSAAAVERAVDRAATRAERSLAWIRIGAYGLEGLRAAFIWSRLDFAVTSPTVLVSLTVMVLAIAFSTLVLRHTTAAVATPGWRLASVALDMLLCTASLSVTTLWPAEGYVGLLALPDPYILLLLIVGGGFRLSGPVAVAGGVMAGFGAGVLVAIDAQMNAAATASSMPHLSFFTMLVLTATTIAWLFAVSTRRIATAGAQDALRAERARHDLDQLLRGHHDLSSALSAAALDSRALADSLRGDDDLGELATDLQAGVTRLTDQIRSLREHAWVASGTLDAPATDTATVAREVIDALRATWPTVHFDLDEMPDAPVAVPGGPAILRHVLHNLLANACEGDGRRGARRVTLGVEIVGGWIALKIDDDGPGFTDAQLARPLDERGTTKRRGSGLGLMMIGRLLDQLGGGLQRTNSPGGGASVKVDLPLTG